MSNPINNPEELIQSVLRIFRTEMALKQDQTLIQNQSFRIPRDSRLYLSVGLIGGRTFAVKTQYVANPDTPEQLTQIQGVNRQELLSIRALSKGEAALQRNWEIPVALKSLTSQQAQEAGSFKIADVPVSMVDVSGGEGARRLYEYSLTVAVLIAYRKTSDAPFYDNFQTPAIITNQ